MRISRKAEYALRSLCAMARKPAAAVSQIEELADSEHIPVKFLEQILLTMKKAGLLRSRRGVGGGYQLELPPHRITLSDILTAVDGPFQPMACTPAEPGKPMKSACECGIAGGCGCGKVFTELQNMVHQFLSRTTLSDLLARDPANTTLQFDI
jgi:Rrf2 family protein